MHRRLVALAAIASGLLLAGPVLANHVEPQLVSEASSCGPLAPGTVELVVEVPQDLAGTIEDGDFSAVVSLDGSVGNGSISFSDATLPVKAVFVAGVNGGNLYAYEEPVTSDEGLVSPDNQPIADVSFCYVTEGEGGEGGAAPSADTAGGSEGEGEGEGAGATEGTGRPPATDLAAGPRSPLLSLVLVSVGLGLVMAGLAVGLPKRGLRSRR